MLHCSVLSKWWDVLSTHRRPPPFISQAREEQLVATVKKSEPHGHALPGHNWSIKKLLLWVKATFVRTIGRSTLRKLLRRNRPSWEKCQKVLRKADPTKRIAYINAFQTHFAQVCQGEVRLLYRNESHFHRDMNLGYTWAEQGKVAWRLSDCPPLHDRIDWYGAYGFSCGQCFTWTLL